jgi:hypothetical protein
MTSVKLFFGAAVVALTASAQSITFSGPLTVNAINPSGTSFAYSGTLTQAATISLTASGTACEQAGSVYCTNAAGVAVVAGAGAGVGQTSTFSATFSPTSGTWNFGALLMNVEGECTVQLFPANASNGLGSGSPPSSLSLNNVSLASLGCPTFSITSPAITLFVADSNYPDNSQGFTVTSGARSPTPSPTPLPSTLVLSMVGLAALAVFAASSRFFLGNLGSNAARR